MSTKIAPTQLSFIHHIPEVLDEGYLHFAEALKHIPFPIRRFYLISKVQDQAVRGFHAHRRNKQMLFCIQGSITIVLDNGHAKEEVILSSPTQGIFLDVMMWHEMKDFQPDTILLVVASEPFEEADYIREYQDFLHLVHAPKTHWGRVQRWMQDFWKKSRANLLRGAL